MSHNDTITTSWDSIILPVITEADVVFVLLFVDLIVIDVEVLLSTKILLSDCGEFTLYS